MNDFDNSPPISVPLSVVRFTVNSVALSVVEGSTVNSVALSVVEGSTVNTQQSTLNTQHH
ncbi:MULTISPECIES: hypothetical protein [Microcoleaceae]|uniref:hypothetical protein n=1 Tax=Microcoleaceae TaxID=1892252 RepID=UPI001881E9A4|nr:hypothetical protein [Tychonema sp. LEGE 06208]MBE9165807.1 hypothetical protein [Tychonema sp. LEGE 06208]